MWTSGQRDRALAGFRGVRREPCSDRRRYFKMEIPAGAFERRIRVPETIRVEDISVAYADGLLQIRLPKEGPAEVPIDPR